MHPCKHIHTYTHTHTLHTQHATLNAHTHTHAHTHMHVCMHACTLAHTYMHTHIRTHTCMYACTLAPLHTHTCIHTRTRCIRKMQHSTHIHAPCTCSHTYARTHASCARQATEGVKGVAHGSAAQGETAKTPWQPTPLTFPTASG